MQISTINSSISENSNNNVLVTNQKESNKSSANNQTEKSKNVSDDQSDDALAVYGGSLATNKDGDTLEISDAGASASSENTISEDILQDLINQADSASDSGDTYAKIIKIFQRIARGDHDPAND